MPLWTILLKCPAPTGPACTKPAPGTSWPDSSFGVGGLSASKIGCTLATSSAVPPTISA